MTEQLADSLPATTGEFVVGPPLQEATSNEKVVAPLKDDAAIALLYRLHMQHPAGVDLKRFKAETEKFFETAYPKHVVNFDESFEKMLEQMRSHVGFDEVDIKGVTVLKVDSKSPPTYWEDQD